MQDRKEILLRKSFYAISGALIFQRNSEGGCIRGGGFIMGGWKKGGAVIERELY